MAIFVSGSVHPPKKCENRRPRVAAFLEVGAQIGWFVHGGEPGVPCRLVCDAPSTDPDCSFTYLTLSWAECRRVWVSVSGSSFANVSDKTKRSTTWHRLSRSSYWG